MHHKRLVAVALLAFVLTGLLPARGHAQEPVPDPIFNHGCVAFVTNDTSQGDCNVHFEISGCGPNHDRIFVCTITVCTVEKKGYLHTSESRECYYN